ncbi:flagellar protein FliS [Pullulanibacillus camelliae]|uniref:Flagellar secretion chaperone FliS n=2 Tax=Pullulanibacillus camelliae TaxID=1707096 RepID=A0A8J2YGJ2_9BACL|nr:flagellar protein FliS [Pullulanibacillus camelliae]
MANPYQAYQQNSVTTASPGELTLMLYNGCLKFIKQGKAAIMSKNIQDKNTNLQKAQKIIMELMTTLNMDIELSKQLLPLYDYINRRLIEANIKQSVEMLDEVEEMLSGIRDSWKQALQITRQNNNTQKQAVGRV